MRPRIVLASMPCAPIGNPSIGLGLLAASLEAAGFECHVRHFNLRFLDLCRLGAEGTCELHIRLTSDPFYSGDWLFARSVFGDALPDDEGTVARAVEYYARGLERPDFADEIRSIRSRVDRFLDDCAAEVEALEPDLIGLSTTFLQTVASIGLARRLKARRPDRPIVLGGANTASVMGVELLRSFAEFDFALRGEADRSLVEFVTRFAGQRSVEDVPGVLFRDGTGVVRSGPPSVNVDDMDALPYPDYDEFFEAFAASRIAGLIEPRIPFESARGCWWGARQHCTFCGLNANGMAYRTKSADRTLDEIRYLTGRHGARHLAAVDNIISMDYFRDFLPRLADLDLDLDIFYETKSNLDREHLALMRAAGLRWVQPGIESLSTPILKLMRKGVTAIQNVQTLKFAFEERVQLGWIFLYGFGNEPVEEYGRMAGLVDRIRHLQPPMVVDRVIVDRFSPLHETPEPLGLTNVRAKPIYRNIFPLSDDSIERLAWHFDYDFIDERNPAAYATPLFDAIDRWQAGFDRDDPLLSFVVGPRSLLVTDRRAAEPRRFLLRGRQRGIFLYLDRIRNRAALARHLAASPPPGEYDPMGSEGEMPEFLLLMTAGDEAESTDLLGGPDPEGDLDAFLDWLDERGLIVVEGRRYLALPVRWQEASIPMTAHSYGL